MFIFNKRFSNTNYWKEMRNSCSSHMTYFWWTSFFPYTESVPFGEIPEQTGIILVKSIKKTRWNPSWNLYKLFSKYQRCTWDYCVESEKWFLTWMKHNASESIICICEMETYWVFNAYSTVSVDFLVIFIPNGIGCTEKW